MPRWSEEKKRQVFRLSGGRCHVCNKAHTMRSYGSKWDIDHLQPRSRNGRDSIYNLAVACIPCNRSKGNETSLNDLATAVVNKMASRGMAGPRRAKEQEANQPGRPRNMNSQRRNQGRVGICTICEQRKRLVGDFCPSCERKSRSSGINKRENECSYGRCTRKREAGGLLSMQLKDYCPQHQRQFERGILGK